MADRVYLGANAREMLRPQALEAAMAALGVPGNPASVHQQGRQARRVLEDARESIAVRLGADPAGYSAYVAGVRSEYRHVDDDDWRTGRAAVLRGFLERSTIFLTAGGQERWESGARANVASELAALRAR